MKKPQLKSQQSGFTLIELVVVIVILGILAATALPRFSDLSTDARMAKMHAATAAVKTASSLFHAQWLASGSPADTTGNSGSTDSVITMEGAMVAFIKGYPDVGGDGGTDADAVTTASSGIAVAAGGLADYNIATSDKDTLLIRPDSTRTGCVVIYTQAASAGAAPVIDESGITTSNCS